ncbi:UDP-N-acetyl glucosamine 2-epimerase [Halolactibacillus alkaliphilus]|uniref:UDP-N-acetyl glucosamine 2-epimerase n=1 Tax=Halolactibacillus alkaliphilus TaxID=442899 RepID=A0A511X2G7_9BACI|nr:UDP-N-acetylglucosamine 2-epimerase [Halolactibacillus alkaliphilus]GEN57111.1 UDP-N-acetyl glucosamine 2-epimerase [Halolactibacillus alkaliphilus]GGN72009.1 UDP-N-acetyl glucosamine 2-epimerase [Halolactibacillus alkaliphilus]SFO86665.1 GDP/UDP-N,N'-diacetylbacillosamine 2-epimerase (hydrolysing) [Halolactibacillus alkaliphilus]
MKKLISILTATRAEYGLLKPIILKLNKVKEFDVRVVATGAHLSPEFGLTYQEIERDGFAIDKKIDILLSSDTPSSISKSMGLAMISFADYFEKLNPDLLIVLGDRYETLAVATTAMNQRIPIAHLYGGETTEGAIDESIRHAITKLSYLHFTSTNEYRNRVIQLGENPERVYNVGAIGIENILNEKLLQKEELENELNISLSKPYAVVTFHPVTLEENSSEKQIESLLEVCKKYNNLDFIFTKANADAEGRIINQFIDRYAKDNDNIFAYASLGMKRYLSALKYCRMVIGNSSSGLVEAPSFSIPTVNIGDRQKGRMQASSVINCEPTQLSIHQALGLALSDKFAHETKKTVNPYGNGDTSNKVVEVIKDCVINNKIDLKKKFYDCVVEQ